MTRNGLFVTCFLLISSPFISSLRRVRTRRASSASMLLFPLRVESIALRLTLLLFVARDLRHGDAPQPCLLKTKSKSGQTDFETHIARGRFSSERNRLLRPQKKLLKLSGVSPSDLLWQRSATLLPIFGRSQGAKLLRKSRSRSNLVIASPAG
jgi:hypothetical protein